MQKKNSIKANNQKKVLDFLRSSGDTSIAEISQVVYVSKPTIKKIIDYYQAKGLVQDVGKGDSTEEGGKKPTIFRFNKDYGCVVAVHLGPDFIYGAACDLFGDIIHSQFLSINFKDLDRVIDKIIQTIRDLLDRISLKTTKIVGISLALPGVVDVKDGLSVFSPHYVEWGTRVEFLSLVRDRLAMDVPIFVENVNRLQAFAEMVKGKAKDKRNFVIVDAIYEGLGAGIVLNGQMHIGAESLSGEIGHMVLQPENGPVCICGGKGCFEALVSINRLKKNLEEKYDANKDSLIYRGTSPDDVLIGNLFAAFRQEDGLALEIMDDIAKWFAIGLNNVIMVYDPEMIILQGIYSEAGIRFLDMLKEKMDHMSLPYINRQLEIVFSDFGRERGVIGAAAYALSIFFESTSI